MTDRTPFSPVRMAACLALAAVMGVASYGIGTVPPARAQTGEAATAQVRYRVSYGAVPLGSMDMRVRIGPDDRYDLEATFGTGGLVRLIRSTKGSVEASGTLGTTVVPASFSLAYDYGDRSRARAIAFENGEVRDVRIEPPPRADDERTPPAAAQLAGAIDPAGALLVPTPGGSDPCRRSVRVFDGRALIEVALSPSRNKPFRAGGWRGEVRVCDVAAVPVAGMRDTSREEIAAVRGASLALVPVPGAEVWIAAELRVPSSVGMVSVRAVDLSFAG